MSTVTIDVITLSLTFLAAWIMSVLRDRANARHGGYALVQEQDDDTPRVVPAPLD